MPTDVTNTSDAARLIEAAHELGPTITAMRDEIDRERRLPVRLVETLHKHGFFNLWLTRDRTEADRLRAASHIASGRLAAAWCTMAMALDVGPVASWRLR